MDFIDRCLVRLADATTRAALFDQASLEQLASAAYDTDDMLIQGPFQALFDEFNVGIAPKALGTIEGSWRTIGAPDFTEVRLHTSGIGAAPLTPRIDCLWRGSIVVRSVPLDSQITSVETQWPDVETVDAEIIASLGSLPADRAVLEQERRSRFVARVRAILEQPDGFTDASLTPWLRQVGVASVGELLTRFRGVIHAGGVRVAFAPPAAVEPFPMALPLTAAILIRDIGMSVSRLLVESKLVRDQLASHGLERPHDPGLRPRATPLIVWAVPAETFDDADWPGGTDEMDAAARRLARRDAASQWLGREGIGVVAID